MNRFLPYGVVLPAVLLIGLGGSVHAMADVKVRRINGPPLRGEALILKGDKARLTAAKGAAPQSVPRRELISIRFAGRPDPPNSGGILEFANGDRLIVTILDVRDGALRARVSGETIEVPLGRLRGIVWDASAIAAEDRRLLFREQGANDVVLLINGDRLAGRFAGVSQEEVTLLLDEREVAIPTERLALLAFSPELISTPAIPVERQIVIGPAGWVTVTGLRGSSEAGFTGQTLYGDELTFELGEFQRIQFFGPRVVSLTDLEPNGVAMIPWLSQAWPVRWNRSPTDRPLELGGRIYARGLGVHSKTRVTYPLGGNYDRFSVRVGLAESAGAMGNVLIAIEVDEKTAARREAVTLADGPVEFNDIPLAGGESLSLIVGFGASGNIRDRVNWCAPLLIRGAERQQ